MEATQIGVAIIMVGIAFAGIAWLYRSEAAQSARRMVAMMKRVGLDPETAMLGGPPTMAIRQDARRRCRRCPREELCERWLAGEVEGGNSFCPNARAFRILTGAGEPPNATASPA